MADKKISALTAATTPLAGTEVLPIVQGGATVKVSVANLTAGRTTNAFQYTSTVSEASQQAISCISANLNTVVTNGSYAGYSATNAPEGTAAWIFLTVTSNGTDQIYQTCAIAGYVNGQTYKRFSADSGASWTSWVLISANTTGNIAFASGNGIDFSATPGTGTSELLDDYEEGSWTPVVTDGTNDVSMAAGAGWYIKVGKVVTIGWNSYYLNIASLGALAQVRIKSLPFTAAAKDTWSAANFPFDNVGKNYCQRIPASGTNLFFFVTQASAGDFADCTRTTLGGTAVSFFGSMTYYTA